MTSTTVSLPTLNLIGAGLAVAELDELPPADVWSFAVPDSQIAPHWPRPGMGRGIQAGRVWTNCYHAYPAHAAFGGYKQSGIGRENHNTQLIIDVVPGRGGMFSIEGPTGQRFLTRSRLYSDGERRALEAQEASRARLSRLA